jgi:hypothetical protein
MLKLKFIACLLVLLTFINCEEDCGNSCPAPSSSELKLKLTINEENPQVEVVIFRGRIESQDIVLTETVSDNVVWYELDPDGYYSVTASYQQGNKEIIVINGKGFSLTDDDCGCGRAQNYSLNMKLKN